MTPQRLKEAEYALLRLWDQAVGTPGYDKKQFILIQSAILTARELLSKQAGVTRAAAQRRGQTQWR